MIKYSILTEASPGLYKLVSSIVEGATILMGVGIYHKMKERSAQIILMDVNKKLVEKLARKIKVTNKQSEVWITKEVVELQKI